ncbi:MAG: PAS domain S-box protein [Syntrophales bacterium]|nr:PAS domain S-box protein [Syntrophales bacterium]
MNTTCEPRTQNVDLRVLILEDSPGDAELIARALSKEGIAFTVRRVETREAFLKELEEFNPDLILADYALPAFDGLSALALVKEKGLDVPFIFVTGTMGEERAIETMRRGATDYVFKNRLAKLAPAVLRALRETAARKERLHALEMLQKSEEEYRNLFDNVDDVIFSLDLDWRVLSVTPSVERVMGYKPEEVTGKSVQALNVLTPSSLKKATSILRHVMKGERVEGTLYEYFAKDGTKRFGEVNSTPLFRDGKVVAAIAVLRDVTERKAAEDEARLNLARQQALLDLHQQMPGASIREIINFVVEKCVSLTGSAIGFIGLVTDDEKFMEAHLWSEKAIGECSLDTPALSSIEQVGLWAEPIRQRQPVICNDYGAPSPLKRGCPPGHIGLTRYMGIPVLDNDRVVAIAGLGNKAAEYTGGDLRSVLLLLESMWTLIKTRSTEEARRETAVRLSMALAASSMAAWEWDLRSDEIVWSSESHSVLGLEGSHGKFRRDSFASLMDPEDAARVNTEIERALKEKSTFAMEFRITRTDGEVRWVSDVGRGEYDADGRAVRLVGTLQDITERKRAEEEREKILAWQQGINALQQSLLAPAPLEDKLRSITDGIVSLFNADFSRIWLIQPGDLCKQDCIHAEVNEGPHACRHRDRCLHLLASSGRYTHTDGKIHRRIPFDCYKIGHVASGNDHKFITNDVRNDPKTHNREWACELGLVSFAGYQLRVPGGKTLGVLALFAKHPISSTEDAILDGLSSATALVIQRDGAEKSLFQTLESLRRAVQTTIQVLVSAVEVRDPYTAGHQIRSADLARAIAIEMGLSQDKIDGIRMAGSIHDIGKLSIPAEILSKPIRLTDIEFDLIKEHARKGYEMLKDVESPWPLAQIVHQHHERMNGTGYPGNLQGDEILMEARILAVADVVESIASHRPYRPAMGIDAALEEISQNRDILYDSDVVDACLRLFRERGYHLATA